MTQAIRRFFLFLVHWLKPVDAPTAPTARAKRAESNLTEDCGRFYFRRDILDKLDGYFDDIAVLRRSYPDQYKLFSRVGAQIVSGGINSYIKELETKVARGPLNWLWRRCAT
jgi:hypothetical protein